MPLSVHWFLPTAGDSRDVVGFGPTAARREGVIPRLRDAGLLASRSPLDARPAALAPTAQPAPVLAPASAS